MSQKAQWTLTDAINRPTQLRPEDRCLYLHVYTPEAGYGHSYANQLVLNYKKPIFKAREDPRQQYYKDRAVQEYADALVGLFNDISSRIDDRRMSERGTSVALVPVPPSQPSGHPDYDDRNERVCQMVCEKLGLSYCPDIALNSYIGSSHGGGSRNPYVLSSAYVRSSLACNEADTVFVIDDTLVSGAHFVACKTFLEETGCTGQIYGVFLARSVRER